MFGLSQGSILGPILFIIFITDLFFINNTNFASYANDTTLYDCGQNFNEAINFLENNINNKLLWFQQNGLIPKSGQSHFLINPYYKKLYKYIMPILNEVAPKDFWELN